MRVAIIPARGGSKRIPKKNIRNFHGRPIIAYSIDAARESGLFDRVVVSTDSDDIAEVARAHGAEVPFRRPEALSSDHAPTIPVVRHAVETLEASGCRMEQVCCIYATAPFVTGQTLTEAHSKLKAEEDLDYVFSATRFSFPIQRAFYLTPAGRVTMAFPEFQTTRSQDLTEAYHDAGQFYWGTSTAFKQERPIFSKRSSPYLLPSYLVQDIDTLEDWKRAEFLMATITGSSQT